MTGSTTSRTRCRETAAMPPPPVVLLSAQAVVPPPDYRERRLTDWSAMSGEARLTRRAVLGLAARAIAATAAGCRHGDRGDDAAAAPDPDAAVLATARRREQVL